MITVWGTRIERISWIAFTAAACSTPVLVGIAVAGVLAETLAMFGVKVICCWAFVGFALAFAVNRVKIEVARAVLVSAETSAEGDLSGIRRICMESEELLASWASQWLALTSANFVVERLSIFASRNNAFEFTILKVPCLS